MRIIQKNDSSLLSTLPLNTVSDFSALWWHCRPIYFSKDPLLWLFDKKQYIFLQRYWVIPLVYIRVDKSFEFLNEFTFSFHLFDSSLKGFYFGYFISLPLGKPDFKLSPRYHWQHSTPSVMYKYIQLFSIFQLS